MIVERRTERKQITINRTRAFVYMELPELFHTLGHQRQQVFDI